MELGILIEMKREHRWFLMLEHKNSPPSLPSPLQISPSPSSFWFPLSFSPLLLLERALPLSGRLLGRVEGEEKKWNQKWLILEERDPLQKGQKEDKQKKGKGGKQPPRARASPRDNTSPRPVRMV